MIFLHQNATDKKVRYRGILLIIKTDPQSEILENTISQFVRSFSLECLFEILYLLPGVWRCHLN